VAFQTGSALGKLTGGVLKDVPHFVRGPNAGSTVVRNTLAVLTQTNLGGVVDLKTGMIFGEPSGSLTRSMREMGRNAGDGMHKICNWRKCSETTRKPWPTNVKIKIKINR
jgi:hypothetical protein